MEQPTDRYSILLIEDNPLDAELARGRLLAGGLDFELVVADCRARFDEEFGNKHFDLVLADYSLPDFDGLTALKIVRAVDKRLPFVFVSGVLGEDVAVETLLQGATDYVIKQKLERLVPAVVRSLKEHAEFVSRERAEHELRQVEERLREITNSLPAMVWTCDQEGKLTFVNSVWTRCVGEASCWFDDRVVHSSDRSTCEQIWQQAQELGEPFELDCRYKMLADGSYRWQLVRATPLHRDVGSPKEWVGTCTDIEVQKDRDIQLKTAEKLALTGRMASVIAHEINNPLEALGNILYLLRDEVRTESGLEYLSAAENEVLRMSVITKQTLHWSREEGTASEILAEKLIEETLKLFSGKLKNKEVILEKSIDPTIKIKVVAGEIRQVLANLISNAIDAVPIGGTIVVGAAPALIDGESHIELFVADNGKGIPPEELTQLFRPFQTTKGPLGNGLGLYVSKEIIDRHDGRLDVETAIDAGTRMRVLIPAGPTGASSANYLQGPK